ncbi:MAG: type II toxin-antitoxin system VapC family toxin [Planctomycetota bacterium]
MGLRLALDANRYVDFCKGVEAAVQTLRRASQIALPFIVVGELRAGFRCGDQSRRNESTLTRFLQSERVSVLLADEGTTHIYASLFADLRSAGTPIPTNDLWIAALVMQHELVLFSRDKHFDCLRQIPRL